MQILYDHSAPGAAYNSKERYDPPKCHLNTRTRLLNTTRKWARKGRPRMMWLYGSAGAGKSAVAQTFAMELRAASNLTASFFFSRTAHVNSHRGHEERFVTTIAYQLAEVVPNLQGYVEHVIVSKPSVFNLALTEQVMALIIEPLKALQQDMASRGGTSCVLPRVVVIDGLDECEEESGQIQVLDALATLVSHQDVFPCSVFLASRPEVAIRTWMTNKQSEDPQLLWSISLLDHCDSDHDIEVFVNDETAKMKQSHPLKYRIPAGWPSPELVNEIIKRASGQFVFAATIIKYIKDLRGHPCERLEAILKHTLPSDDRPYADLDALYLHILRQTKHPKLVHQILAFRITTTKFWGCMYGVDSRDYLRILLSLPYSVHTLLVDLQSVMRVDEDWMQFMEYEWDNRSTVFHHASLLEFLLDPHRSEEFYVDTPSMDKELYETTLRHLGAPVEPDLPAVDDQYIIYCFLILLQTRTSRHPSFRDQVIGQLTRWDTLHNLMLYMTLYRLHGNQFWHPDHMVNIMIDQDLWSVFAPAVATMPVRIRQEFESARLPLGLLVMYQARIFPSMCTPDSNIHPDYSVKLVDWHLKVCIQRDTGVNICNFFSSKKHQFLLKDHLNHDWHKFLDVLDEYLPAPEKEGLEMKKLKRNARAKYHPALATAAAVFSIRHINSMFDALEDLSSSRFIVENQDLIDHLKRTGGETWRALLVSHLLSSIGMFIWEYCPLSADVVLALEETSQKIFPPHIISRMENTTFPFDFSHSESWSLKALLHSFSSEFSPCTLPRWYLLPPHFSPHYSEASRRNLGRLHDYIRSESSWIYSCDTEHDGDWDGEQDLTASKVAKQTIDPSTGICIDWNSWSMSYRWIDFERCYEEVKRQSHYTWSHSYTDYPYTPRGLYEMQDPQSSKQYANLV
ncbi:hypothetical protein BJ165DRAFT_643235 [Panaeolus papilionaceus]|nr:hypothetical protein BJ165DRAFT_643235 [Panaeolus papilionaceus]